METITIDAEFEIPIYSEICHRCKNLHKDLKIRERKCTAFPELIPLEIWLGDFNHKAKHPDQTNDILFELDDKYIELLK